MYKSKYTGAEIEEILDDGYDHLGLVLKTYLAPSQLGLTGECTLSELYAALPNNSEFICTATDLTDSSWNFPTTYATVHIVKVSASRSGVFLYGKNSIDYRMWISSSNAPDGNWYAMVTEGNSSSISVGNAATATKLATARTIRTNLASTSTASFDGTANITPGVTGTLPIANGGTGNTTGLAATATKLATARTIRTNLASTSTASFDGSANITPGVTGILPVANGGTGYSTLEELAAALEEYLSAGGGSSTSTSVLNSLQRGSTTVSNGKSTTATISSVDMDKSVVIVDQKAVTGRLYPSAGSATDTRYSLAGVYLSSSTELTFVNDGDSPVTVYWQVVEFA